MKITMYVASFMLSLIVFLASVASSAEIMDDTTIDNFSPYNGARISVHDGQDGRVIVSIVDGGSVEGFTVEDSSHVVLEGGEVTLLSSASGSSTFTLKSGIFGCNAAICSTIDYDSLLTVSDEARVNFQGGTFNDLIRLEDAASAHFFGSELAVSTFDSSTFSVTGKYRSGNEFAVLIHRFDGDQRIVLHEIPEPRTLHSIVLCACGISFLMRKWIGS